jgi:hypothetical protein
VAHLITRERPDLGRRTGVLVEAVVEPFARQTTRQFKADDTLPEAQEWALLLSTDRSTENPSWAVTARIPGTLLALIATPSPVPHTRSARSALPDATILAAITAICG